MAKMREQALKFGAEVEGKRVTKVDFSVRPFKLWTGDTEYQAHTVIISTGAVPLTLGLDDEWRLMGRGVSTCATCDGFFFRGKDIIVVGGGDAAMEEATFLTNFAKSVTIVHRRDQLRASPVMADRAKSNPKITFRWNTQVVGLEGEDKLTGVQLRDTVTGKTSQFATDGMFVAIGHKPSSEIFAGQLKLDDMGYVITDGVKTSIEGVFAAGDVQDRVYRQAITSAGTGCMAALDAQHYLESHHAHASPATMSA